MQDTKINDASLFLDDDSVQYQESCHQKATKCDCDVAILEFLIDSFICMFPEPDCYCPCHHDEEDSKAAHCFSCSCMPCGDNSDCYACFPPGLYERDSDIVVNTRADGAATRRGSIEQGVESKRENEEDDDDYYGWNSADLGCFNPQ